MIILAIKSCFFFGADSFNFGWKPQTYHFFFLFCREIIRVVGTMLGIAIEDLEVHLSISNLPIEKNVIYFKLLAQKKKTGKQTTGILIWQKLKICFIGVYTCLEKTWAKTLSPVNIRLFQTSGYKLSSKRLGERRRTLRFWQFLNNIKTLWMILLTAQIQSLWIGQDQLMWDSTIPLGLKPI